MSKKAVFSIIRYILLSRFKKNKLKKAAFQAIVQFFLMLYYE